MADSPISQATCIELATFHQGHTESIDLTVTIRGLAPTSPTTVGGSRRDHPRPGSHVFHNSWRVISYHEATLRLQHIMHLQLATFHQGRTESIDLAVTIRGLTPTSPTTGFIRRRSRVGAAVHTPHRGSAMNSIKSLFN
ncbi:hypothetical protein J6590_061829 [Homalodisca vitripennis]|nr:hypothetical protein J6590_061829 [Homalodisca vitripennis]